MENYSEARTRTRMHAENEFSFKPFQKNGQKDRGISNGQTTYAGVKRIPEDKADWLETSF